MKAYFKECQTLDEAKTLFRKLSHELHPDKGGTHEQFIELKRQFENFRPERTFKSDKDFNKSKFYDLVEKFENLNNIKVSFVGSFIWLEDAKQGATYEQKDRIKDIEIDGMNSPRYARKKKAWYFSPEDYKRKSRKSRSLEEIKNFFGSEEFQTKQQYQIA